MTDRNEHKNINIDAENVHLGNTYISGGLKEPNVTDLLGELFLTDAFDDLAKTRRLKGKRVKGTCEWVLARTEYSDWAAGDGLQLLWLIGAPGIGKTVISCFLIEELQQLVQKPPSTAFAYYFCDNKDDQRRTVTAILRGVLVQLLKERPELFDLVKEDYKIQKGSLTRNVDSLWKVLVRILRSHSNQVYILIDALDECEKSSRGELLDLLADLDPSAKARILITSRPESDIEETKEVVGQSLRLDSAKINNDLAKFIDIKVDELRKKKDYPVKLVEDVRNALRDHAGGTFLWASLVLKDIAATKTAKAARKKLDSMPSDLPGIYQKILDNISEDDMDDAVFILQWVVVSRRPMTVIELATAATLGGTEGWDENTVPPTEVLDELKDGFRSCGPLLYHDPDDDTVNLVHQSAKDYLVAMDPLSPYRVDKAEASMQTIKTCWKYLTMQGFGQGAVIISRSETNQLVPAQLSKRVLESYGFLGYATEELRDGQIEERLDLITAFVAHSENLEELAVLRDYWLIVSVASGHVEGVQTLLDKHADTAVRSSEHYDLPVLQVAAANGHGAIVQLLVTKESNVTSAREEETALYLAASNGQTEACRILIDNGAEIEAKNYYKGKTALHGAVDGGHKAVVVLLLEKGANVNSEDDEGNIITLEERSSALSMAVRKGHEDVVRVLLESGVESDAKDSSEETALNAAASGGHEPVIRILLEAGADVGVRDFGGWSPLMSAAASRHHHVIKVLLDWGADPSDRHHWATALSHAATNGELDAVRALLDGGAAIDAGAGYTNWAPLHMAVMEGREAVVELLLSRGANIHREDSEGHTPIYFALDRVGTETIVPLLLQYGADPKTIAEKGETLASWAMEHPPAVVLGLLALECECFELGGREGQALLTWAIEEGHDGVIDCLLQKGVKTDVPASEML